MHDLLSLAQAAELLGCSRNHVLQLVKRGQLPGLRIGRAYAVARAAILAYAEQRKSQQKT